MHPTHRVQTFIRFPPKAQCFRSPASHTLTTQPGAAGRTTLPRCHEDILAFSKNKRPSPHLLPNNVFGHAAYWRRSRSQLVGTGLHGGWSPRGAQRKLHETPVIPAGRYSVPPDRARGRTLGARTVFRRGVSPASCSRSGEAGALLEVLLYFRSDPVIPRKIHPQKITPGPPTRRLHPVGVHLH